MKTGKNFKIFGIRGSLIGDTIMALPILNYIEKVRPDSYKYWFISKKCSQAAQLYFNHPLIDKIVISDIDDGYSERDMEIVKKCDVVFNPMPQHPTADNWPNERNIYEETWVMAGLSLDEYNKLSDEEKRPKLYKWFDNSVLSLSNRKKIAIWPCAGYGKENRRNPSEQWYKKLVEKLVAANFEIYQFGHPNDFDIVSTANPHFKSQETIGHSYDLRHLSFFEQIRATLSCDLMIGTDSGSALVIGAYDLIPQISLLTNHWPGHIDNPLAFATNAPKNINFFAKDCADNIDMEQVFSTAQKQLSK